MDKFRAIVVDDEPSVCEAVKAILELEGIEVTTFLDSVAAAGDIGKKAYDLIISDLKMPDMNGLELYDKVRDAAPGSTFIIITAFGTIPSAVEAIKKGIYDYIPKPFTPDEVRIPVRRALEKSRLERENDVLRSQIESRYSFRNIIGNSSGLREAFRIMRHAALSESNVLISGESGTGKELAARAIHANSIRARGKFVTVNCDAVPDSVLETGLFGHVKGAVTGATADKKGLMEEADRGTLFFDEIGALSAPMQVRLLRVLQEGEFARIGEEQPRKINMRIVAATNKDLRDAITSRLFREDLYYRLNVIPIELPPLGKRPEDIPLLINHFIEKHRSRAPEKNVTGIDAEGLQTLIAYRYPGNVRELENAVEYAIASARGGLILKGDLPPNMLGDTRPGRDARKMPVMPLKEAKNQLEKGLIVSALEESGGNISEAARLLNVNRQNLQQKIRLLGIDLASI